MKRCKKWLALLAVAVTLSAAANGRAAETADVVGPADVVGQFHDSLLAVMKEADALGVHGRFERLADPVSKAFDLKRMIRVASNPYWKSVGEDKQAALVEAFGRMSTATYAFQFKGYSGERFETQETRPGPRGTLFVVTKILAEDGSDEADLTYVMKKGNGRWKIADVLLDNKISQLAIRISEYRNVLKTGGIDGLITSLHEAADKLLSD
ncbi:MAG: ABC transporter substrate-binding protein [Rhodospirillales bacterium]|nr:ABC transporter substrate-binding protein [Rhodospirillales bacterium]